MKLDLKRALDISRVLSTRRPPNQVWRVGVELEGGWIRDPKNIYANVRRDGSVDLSGMPATDLAAIGEIPSPVLETAEFPAWMKAYYPKYINHTCGMHVHMSFKTALTYMRLMEASYPATVIVSFIEWAKAQKLKDNHPIWERLKGNSRYAQFQFAADLQTKTTEKDHDQRRPGHRYTVINYCHSRNGALECRLLPMMDSSELGIKAVQHLVDTTNAYLLVNKKKELKRQAAVDDEGQPDIEERRIYV